MELVPKFYLPFFAAQTLVEDKNPTVILKPLLLCLTRVLFSHRTLKQMQVNLVLLCLFNHLLFCFFQTFPMWVKSK